MPPALGLGGWLALHFVLALIGTECVRRYALRRNLLDHPGDRRSHAVPTPRGGGLSIVVAMLVALSWLAFTAPADKVLIVTIALGLGLVAGVGWADDLSPRPVWMRLAAHLFAGLMLAAAAWSAGLGIDSALLAVVAVPVLVNVWNFMDGIDGIASSHAAIAALAYGVLSTDPVPTGIAFGLAAACVGFLPHNFLRARIFLGDVGSGSLGFLMAALLVWHASAPGLDAGDAMLAVLPISAFLIDAALTLLRRMVRKEPWWKPHLKHAYQRLAFRLGAHWPVACLYSAWSLLSGALIVACIVQTTGIKILLAACWLVIGASVWFAIQGRPNARNRVGELGR